MESRYSVRACVAALLLTPTIAGAQSFTITRVEVNQAIGVQKDGALKFVAGKDTVVRAFLSAPVEIDPDRTAAVVVRDGVEIGILIPGPARLPVATVDFLCTSRAACGNWAVGDYIFDVTVNHVFTSTVGTTYTFVERLPLRVLAVPIKGHYDGEVKTIVGDNWKMSGQYVRRVYPVAADKFEWTIREELDLSAPRYDLTTPDGEQEVWTALKNLLPVACEADATAMGCFDKIIGFIPEPQAPGEQGFTLGPPANVAVASDEDVAATVAHEIGHNFDLGDVYEAGSFNCAVNPAPNEFTGTYFNDNTVMVVCNAGRTALGEVSATRIPQDHHPYEVGGRGALPDMASFMGSGGRQEEFWVTQDAYDELFDRAAPPPPSPQGFSAVATPAPQRVLYFSGFVAMGANSSADFDLDPFESFIDTINLPDTTGPLMIAGADAGGVTVSTQAIAVEHLIPGPKGQPATVIDPAPFDGIVRFPESVVRFEIVNNGQVIQTLPVSASTPVVSNVTPLAPATVNGLFNIRWTATDADGDDLTYIVTYNPDVTDPDSWYEILAIDIIDPFWLDDFGDLPGGAHAKIMVTATDGLLAASAESAEFVVPFKPPDPYIEDPDDGGITVAGQPLTLVSDVFDLQDEIVADNSLVWSSDLTGEIGRGAVITVRDLPVGEHTVTLTATNSKGLSASDAIPILVVPGRRTVP